MTAKESKETEPEVEEDGTYFKNKGNEEYKKGRYQAAVDLYSQAIEREPETAAFYGNRSAANMMLRNYKSCIMDCQKALDLDPDYVKAHSRLAKAFFYTGECVKSLEAYRAALKVEINPSLEKEMQLVQRCQATAAKCRTLVNQKEWSSALQHSKYLLKEAPDALPFQLLHCESLIHTGKPEDAQQVLTGLVYDNSNNPDVVFLRGLALWMSGQHNITASIKHMRQTLELEPDHSPARELLKRMRQFETVKKEGNTAFSEKKWDAAIEAYTQAMEIDAENKKVKSVLYCNRAAAYKEAGKLTEAIDDCTAAIDIDENYTKAYIRRGRCLQLDEKHERAVRDFEKAKQLEPTREIQQELREAKETLKRSKRKDYYKVLGVPKDAEERQIKKAFREAALVYHPDKLASASQEEKDKGEAKFKELQEAVDVLTDPQKRRRYDNGMDVDGCGGMGGMGGMSGDDLSSVFNMFFSPGGGGGFSSGGRRGGNGRTTFSFNL